MLLHCNSPEESSECVSPRLLWLFRLEDRVALHVYPIVGLSRNVTSQAVFLVVSRDLLIGCVCFEKRPSPSIAPEWVIGIPIFFVLDHDEPHFRLRGPMCVTGCHGSMVGSKDLFHQNRSVGELPILSVVLGCIRRCVRDMHLLSFGLKLHGVGSKQLVKIPNIGWLADVSRLVDKIETAAALALRTNRLLGCYENEGNKQRCNATGHLLMLLFKETNQAGRWSPKQREFGAASEELGKSEICRRVATRLQAASCPRGGGLVLINCQDVSSHCELLAARVLHT